MPVMAVIAVQCGLIERLAARLARPLCPDLAHHTRPARATRAPLSAPAHWVLPVSASAGRLTGRLAGWIAATTGMLTLLRLCNVVVVVVVIAGWQAGWQVNCCGRWCSVGAATLCTPSGPAASGAVEVRWKCMPVHQDADSERMECIKARTVGSGDGQWSASRH